MTPKQVTAAKKLEDALKACASAKLAVYVWDDGPAVAPFPQCIEHPEWKNSPSEVCEEIGKSFSVRGLIYAGGAGN